MINNLSLEKGEELIQENAAMVAYKLHSTQPGLETILGIYPIRRHLMQYLDTRDILKLYRTSWAIRLDIKANEWNVNHRLARFFKDPTAFRSHLGRANALISGSFALQFFERVTWPESDLDIMIRDGDGLEEMDRYLTESEGYTMVLGPSSTSDIGVESEIIEDQGHQADDSDDDNDENYSGRDVIKCQTYLLGEKHQNNGNVTEKRKVQLVVTRGPPVQSILRGYYTTAVINFISWNKAYSVFPRATFLLHETVPLKPVSDIYGTLHSKYSQRGWRMRTEAVIFSGEAHQQPLGDRQLPLGDLTKHGSRRIGDRDSWVMRLGDTAGVQAEEGSWSFVPDFVLEYSCFQVGNLHEQCQNLANMSDWESVRAALCVTIRASLFRSHVLRDQYLVGHVHAFWRKLRAMAMQDLIGQLCKLSASRVDDLVRGRSPAELDHDDLNMLSFDHPKGWDYMDDIVPRLYDQMESEGRIS